MAFRKLAALALTVAFALAGCGGGSGGIDPEDDPKSLFHGFSSGDMDSPAGIWVGTTPESEGDDLQVVVQEDGTVWFMFGKVKDNALTVSGFLHGTLLGHMGLLRSFDLHAFASTGAFNFEGLSATHVPGSSMAGSLFHGTYSIDFSLAPSTSLNYNTPALASNIEGAWNISVFDGSATTATINITANGVMTSTVGPCTISGTVVPSASGKNLYDVTTKHGAGCALANLTTSGIAIWQRVPGSSSAQLIITTVNSARNFAIALSGTR